MTLQQTFLAGKQRLMHAENENPSFDATCLFQNIFGLDRQQLILQGGMNADKQKEKAYFAQIEERAAGRPLQYILGEWPFMDFSLYVGEGVLIPREETELLVYTMRDALSCGQFPAKLCIADLCGGSGAVAIGLASLLPNADIVSVEFYEDAWQFLTKNISRSQFSNVRAEQLNILNPESTKTFSMLDGIISNPPYIKTAVIPVLQTEVQKEPATALDGGEDGLVFYRAIAQIWVPKLKPGGILAVEIGEEQAPAVCALFQQAGVTDLKIYKDFNGLDRVVCGYMEKL